MRHGRNEQRLAGFVCGSVSPRQGCRKLLTCPSTCLFTSRDSRDLDCCRLTPEPLEVHLGGSICPLRKSFWYHRHRLTPELLEARGTSLEAALQTLRQCLPRNAVLVGQNINQDVQWLDLREGIDFEVGPLTKEHKSKMSKQIPEHLNPLSCVAALKTHGQCPLGDSCAMELS